MLCYFILFYLLFFALLLGACACMHVCMYVRVRVQEAVRGTESKKIPLSFDYCIAAQLKNTIASDEVESAEQQVKAI
jgi:hypothetical protein